MVIENKQNIVRYNMRRYIAIVVFIPLISFVLFMDQISYRFYEVNQLPYILTICILYAAFIFVNYKMDYSYFFYSDSESKIIIRFVSTRPFTSSRNSIEISTHNYKGFEIKKSFYNLKEQLIILTNTPKGIAKFPPISITGLNKIQKKQLFHALNDHFRQ